MTLTAEEQETQASRRAELQDYLDRSGVSKQALAAVLRISPSVVSEWTGGTRTISAAMLGRALEALAMLAGVGAAAKNETTQE